MAKAVVDIALLQCRAAIDALDFLNVETDVANALGDEKLTQFIDCIERLRPDDTNNVERHIVPAQGIDAVHDAGMRPLSGPRSPPGIMKPSRPVQTHADTNRMIEKKSAPFLVHQHAIGLH